MTSAAEIKHPVEWPDNQRDAVEMIRSAGVSGAGGAGFPAYAKWKQVDSTPYLLVNHQESEPNYWIDKWLGRERAGELAALFEALLREVFEVVVVSVKLKDRDSYMQELEAELGGSVRMPEELPLDPETESGVVFAYTENTYQYGMENVLLQTVAGTVVGDGLPMDHGWLVQNTESLVNIHSAVTTGTPVTQKYVHVDGDGVDHRFFEAPVGTPAETLFERAGLSGEALSELVFADGGPGWCFAVEESPADYGLGKGTNCLLALDTDTAEANRLGGGRIDVLDSRAWADQQIETAPTASLDPEYVEIPLITNPDLAGRVQPSEPEVGVGQRVEVGEQIAKPSHDGISVPVHASIDGTVTAITDECITVRAS
jgi:Na+-translocating ferredoxin:NAD+ oxidoreductase RnfC subunit